MLREEMRRLGIDPEKFKEDMNKRLRARYGRKRVKKMKLKSGIGVEVGFGKSQPPQSTLLGNSEDQVPTKNELKKKKRQQTS